MNELRGLVLGWYNRQNAGDDRLCASITAWLHDHRLTFMSHTEHPAREMLGQFDYVILGGGSVANSHAGVFRNMASWIRPAGIPVFGVGIGVSKHDRFSTEFQEIIRSGGHVWVRDKHSKRNTGLSESHVDVAPDLSWMLPLAEFPFRREGVAINLRPGGGPRTLDVDQWKSTLTTLKNAWPWPLCFGSDDDRQILSSAFEDQCDSIEFDPTAPSRATLVVAMRFHAILFAIQTRTPFVAITHTKKLEYLLDEIGLTYAAVPHDAPSKFASTLSEVQARMTPDALGEVRSEYSERTRVYASAFKQRIETAAANNQLRTSLPFRVRRKIRVVLNHIC